MPELKSICLMTTQDGNYDQNTRRGIARNLKSDAKTVLQENGLLPVGFTEDHAVALLEACVTNTSVFSYTRLDITNVLNGRLPDYAIQAISAHLAVRQGIAA